MNYSKTYNRGLAFFCDLMAIAFIQSFLTYKLGVDPIHVTLFTLESETHLTISLLSALIFIGYFTLLESSLVGGSLGKRMLGIVIVTDNMKKMMIIRSFLRSVLKLLSTVPLLIGFIPCFTTDDKKGLHDKLAGTIVIDRDGK